MPPFTVLQRLHDHHVEILTIMLGAETLLTDAAVHDIAGLARARWTLMRALTAYQLFTQREVFAPALARATPTEAHRVLLLKRACTDVGDAFRAYVQTWSATDVGAHWATYQPAALAMITRIRAHVATERYEVARLLEKVA